MKIVADENIPLVHEVFDGLGQVETVAGRSITAEQVVDADVLLVRSVTRVDESLLDASSVKFVATCTIGTDHIDLAYLQRQGIGFSAAPGCNAQAVVDYVLSALVILAQGYKQQPAFDLTNRCVGIVGVGNVGRRLKKRLEVLGIRCICNDPHLDDRQVPGLVHLDQLICEADIISVHVPLTTKGDHPTYHLFNDRNLARLNPKTILINTARGAVIDNRALLNILSQRADITAVLDVWEHEPDVSLALLDRVALASPHIAGYSLDGKINGTRMVYQAVCNYLCLPELLDVNALAPTVAAIELKADEPDDVMQQAFDAVLQCYDVRFDDCNFRLAMAADNPDRAASFDALRKNYPVRRELGVTSVTVDVKQEKLSRLLCAFGFKA